MAEHKDLETLQDQVWDLVEDELLTLRDQSPEVVVTALRQAADGVERRFLADRSPTSLDSAAGMPSKGTSGNVFPKVRVDFPAQEVYPPEALDLSLLEHDRPTPSAEPAARELEQAETIARLQSEIEKLRARIRELEAQIAADVPEISAEELALIPVYPGRGTDSLEWYEEHWAPWVREGRVWQHHVREHDPKYLKTLARRCERMDRGIWEFFPPEPGRSGRRRRRMITTEELAAIPRYPGRGTDSLEWYEEHWAPWVRDGRVWQHHLRERDPNLFNTLRVRLYRQGRALWQLVPPEPERIRRSRPER